MFAVVLEGVLKMLYVNRASQFAVDMTQMKEV